MRVFIPEFRSLDAPLSSQGRFCLHMRTEQVPEENCYLVPGRLLSNTPIFRKRAADYGSLAIHPRDDSAMQRMPS